MNISFIYYSLFSRYSLVINTFGIVSPFQILTPVSSSYPLCFPFILTESIIHSVKREKPTFIQIRYKNEWIKRVNKKREGVEEMREIWMNERKKERLIERWIQGKYV